MTESEFYHEDIRELLDNSLCSDEGWMTVYSCFSNYDVDGIDKLERIWCIWFLQNWQKHRYNVMNQILLQNKGYFFLIQESYARIKKV